MNRQFWFNFAIFAFCYLILSQINFKKRQLCLNGQNSKSIHRFLMTFFACHNHLVSTKRQKFWPRAVISTTFLSRLMTPLIATWVYFLVVKFRTFKIVLARFMNERFYKFPKSNLNNYSISQNIRLVLKTKL